MVLVGEDEQFCLYATHTGCIEGAHALCGIDAVILLAVNAARMKGIEAELLIFPDENHWVLKPQNGILWQRTYFEWLDRWLK